MGRIVSYVKLSRRSDVDRWLHLLYNPCNFIATTWEMWFIKYTMYLRGLILSRFQLGEGLFLQFVEGLFTDGQFINKQDTTK